MRLYLKDITSPQQVRDMMELDGSELRHTRNIAGVEKYESGSTTKICRNKRKKEKEIVKCCYLSIQMT